MTGAIISGIGAGLCFLMYGCTRNSKYVPEGWFYYATMGNPDGLRFLVLIVGIICLIVFALCLVF